MPVDGFDFDVPHVFAVGHQGFDQFVRTCGRETPVGAEAGDEKIGLDAAQSSLQVVAVFGGGVEIVQGFGHQQVGVGIEAVGEFVALVAQIAFHFEIHVVVIVQAAVAQGAAEFFAQSVFRQIGDVPHHAGDAQTAARLGAVLRVVSFVEIRVGQDGLARHIVERDVLRA